MLYIAGYGRSGSTLLSMVLSAHPDVASVGEVAFLPDDRLDPSRTCACGASYAECDLWSSVTALEEGMAGGALRRIERFASLAPHLLWGIGGPDADRYGRFQQRLFAEVTELEGASVVVDSSKTAWRTAGRPLALARLADLDVRVLHLIRSGNETLRSLVEVGSNWALEGHREAKSLPGLRATVGWVTANLTASCLRLALGDSKYMQVRFEDFLENPVSTVERIGGFVGLDMGPVSDRLRADGSFESGHSVGGNRIRHQESVKVRRSAPRERPPVRLSSRVAFAILGEWLNRVYGYR